MEVAEFATQRYRSRAPRLRRGGLAKAEAMHVMRHHSTSCLSRTHLRRSAGDAASVASWGVTSQHCTCTVDHESPETSIMRPQSQQDTALPAECHSGALRDVIFACRLILHIWPSSRPAPRGLHHIIVVDACMPRLTVQNPGQPAPKRSTPHPPSPQIAPAVHVIVVALTEDEVGPLQSCFRNRARSQVLVHPPIN